MECTRTFTGFFPFTADGPATTLRRFDLQLFAQEKTEEATPKRREDARNKGQVARSIELSSVFVILAAFLALKLMGPYIYDELTAYLRHSFTTLSSRDLTIVDLQMLIVPIGMVFLKTALPVMAAILLVSLAVNFLQVGFVFTLEPLMPNFDRINPLSGLKRLFSKRSAVEMVKAILKIIIVGFFIYRFIYRETLRLPSLIGMDPADSLRTVGGLTLDLAFQIGGVLLVMAVLDFAFQWWEHNESLKMTKQEVKEEFKQTEGNPLIKGKIKERQRAAAMRRMMQEVPKADVVVTNPDHLAVALRYDPAMSAPVVVAKGRDLVAGRIKEIARENRVTVLENKPLARALFAAVDVGETIPADLYQAVAEVLAYVYRLKRRPS